MLQFDAAAVDAVFNEIDLLRRFKGNPYMCENDAVAARGYVWYFCIIHGRSVSMEDFEEAGRDTVSWRGARVACSCSDVTLSRCTL